MKRKLELKAVLVKQMNGSARVGDVRIRVDIKSLALQLGPKAIVSKGNRITLFGGAIEVDGFNSRVVESPIFAEAAQTPPPPTLPADNAGIGAPAGPALN